MKQTSNDLNPKPDILIKDVLIVDGSGNPSHRGNIIVIGERIAEIGQTSNAAKSVIDGQGLVACPGFIDAHTHADMTIWYHSLAENFTMQGVTTVVAGMCGVSPAPRRQNEYFGVDEEIARRYMDWSSFEDFYQKLETGGIAVNLVPVVGHGTIRGMVMGSDYRRKPRADEIEAMKRHVAEAMETGAFGLSTGLDYIPAKFADNDEIASLAEIAKDFGGIYFIHTRHTNWEWPTKDPQKVCQARYLGPEENVWVGVYEGVMEAIDLGKRVNIPVHMAHIGNLFLTPQPHRDSLDKATAEATVQVIDEAIRQGVDFTYDVVAHESGIGSKERLIDAFLSNFFLDYANRLNWLWQFPEKEFIDNLKTRKFRNRLKNIDESCDLVLGIAAHTKVDPYWADSFKILRCAVKDCEGQVLGDLARRKKTDPLELIFDLIVADPETIWVHFVDRRGTETMISAYLSHPAAFPSSDTFAVPADPDSQGRRLGYFFNTANPPSGAYGLFPHYIANYIKKNTICSLEEGIRKATCLPAQRFGLKDRGILRPGAYADIVLFDLESITDNTDFLVPEKPPSGIELVMVNGTIVHQDKAHTGRKPGKVLRRAETHENNP